MRCFRNSKRLAILFLILSVLVALSGVLFPLVSPNVTNGNNTSIISIMLNWS